MYNPASDGPEGHNASDVLKPWTHTIQDVLDIATLGYTYETAANFTHILALTAALKPPSAFAAEPSTVPGARSPFWAD